MDDLVGKVATGIIVAILLFVLQSLGVHKLILGMVGGTSSPILEELINDGPKNESAFWVSVEKCGKSECYQLYLDKYPQGSFANIAKVQLNGGGKNDDGSYVAFYNDDVDLKIKTTKTLRKNIKKLVSCDLNLRDSEIYNHDFVKSIKLHINKKEVYIPTSSYEDICAPHMTKLRLYGDLSGIFYLRLDASDGAGSADIIFKFNNKRYIGRDIVDFAEKYFKEKFSEKSLGEMQIPLYMKALSVFP